MLPPIETSFILSFVPSKIMIDAHTLLHSVTRKSFENTYENFKSSRSFPYLKANE